MLKRSFSNVTLEEAMQLVPAQNLIRWDIDALPRAPSDILQANLSRLEWFELTQSEAAKVMLIDTILADSVTGHPFLKVWKSAPLDTQTVTGIADYLIAPKRAYLKTPLLCAIEAKRDDFDQGQVQCVAEMAACRDNNKRDGHELDVYGIVSNGQVWVFYKLTTANDVFVSTPFSYGNLPQLLGVLDFVCAACAQNVP